MDTNEAQQYAEVIADELRELEAALEAFIDDGADFAVFDGTTFEDVSEVVGHYVNFCALAVEDVTAATYGADAYVQRRAVEVTRTVGGPGCFVTFNGDGTAVVRAFWGTDRGRVTVRAEYADAELWELMDALAACQ